MLLSRDRRRFPIRYLALAKVLASLYKKIRNTKRIPLLKAISNELKSTISFASSHTLLAQFVRMINIESHPPVILSLPYNTLRCTLGYDVFGNNRIFTRVLRNDVRQSVHSNSFEESTQDIKFHQSFDKLTD